MDFPTGCFSYTVGDASPVVEFDGRGRATATLDGQVIVVAAYRVVGDVLEVTDLEGSFAYPESGWGRYKWSLNGKVLSFSLIEDGNPGRRKGFAQPFIRRA
ncbi:MAG: hypothetical protein IT317_00025 [Anaerolineales bacterium]|nr:hypothetical protein [Anaerolineales bacterium]